MADSPVEASDAKRRRIDEHGFMTVSSDIDPQPSNNPDPQSWEMVIYAPKMDQFKGDVVLAPTRPMQLDGDRKYFEAITVVDSIYRTLLASPRFVDDVIEFPAGDLCKLRNISIMKTIEDETSALGFATETTVALRFQWNTPLYDVHTAVHPIRVLVTLGHELAHYIAPHRDVRKAKAHDAAHYQCEATILYHMELLGILPRLCIREHSELYPLHEDTDEFRRNHAQISKRTKKSIESALLQRVDDANRTYHTLVPMWNLCNPTAATKTLVEEIMDLYATLVINIIVAKELDVYNRRLEGSSPNPFIYSEKELFGMHGQALDDYDQASIRMALLIKNVAELQPEPELAWDIERENRAKQFDVIRDLIVERYPRISPAIYNRLVRRKALNSLMKKRGTLLKKYNEGSYIDTFSAIPPEAMPPVVRHLWNAYPQEDHDAVERGLAKWRSEEKMSQAPLSNAKPEVFQYVIYHPDEEAVSFTNNLDLVRQSGFVYQHADL